LRAANDFAHELAIDLAVDQDRLRAMSAVDVAAAHNLRDFVQQSSRSH
jgi:hypothetical protein